MTYTHGHHSSVLRSHTWRTAENSAAYLLEHLESGQRLLDVGCGPGTITVDLADRVAPGLTVGVDPAVAVVRQAAGLDGAAAFGVADVHRLPFADATFDVAHAHQVLQHLTDPVGALVEMRRVLRPGALLGVRDSDYAGFVWAPVDPRLDRWMELYHQVTRHNGAEADAGRHLLGWVQAAGFRDAVATSSTWTFADDDSRRWWGGLWADRVEQSAFAEQAVAYALSDASELSSIASAWREWSERSDAFFAVVHAEVVARA